MNFTLEIILRMKSEVENKFHRNKSTFAAKETKA
jgi:hypothetical protein